MSARDESLDHGVDRLRAALRRVQYPAALEVQRIRAGDTEALLPVVHFALLRYSPHVARTLLDLGFALFGKTGRSLWESAVKAAQHAFDVRLRIPADKLWANGFAARKSHFVADLVLACREHHAAKERLRLQSSRLVRPYHHSAAGDADDDAIVPAGSGGTRSSHRGSAESGDREDDDDDAREAGRRRGRRAIAEEEDAGDDAHIVRRSFQGRPTSRGHGDDVEDDVAEDKEDEERSSSGFVPVVRWHFVPRRFRFPHRAPKRASHEPPAVLDTTLQSRPGSAFRTVAPSQTSRRRRARGSDDDEDDSDGRVRNGASGDNDAEEGGDSDGGEGKGDADGAADSRKQVAWWTDRPTVRVGGGEFAGVGASGDNGGVSLTADAELLSTSAFVHGSEEEWADEALVGASAASATAASAAPTATTASTAGLSSSARVDAGRWGLTDSLGATSFSTRTAASSSLEPPVWSLTTRTARSDASTASFDGNQVMWAPHGGDWQRFGAKPPHATHATHVTRPGRAAADDGNEEALADILALHREALRTMQRLVERMDSIDDRVRAFERHDSVPPPTDKLSTASLPANPTTSLHRAAVGPIPSPLSASPPPPPPPPPPPSSSSSSSATSSASSTASIRSFGAHAFAPSLLPPAPSSFPATSIPTSSSSSSSSSSSPSSSAMEREREMDDTRSELVYAPASSGRPSSDAPTLASTPSSPSPSTEDLVRSVRAGVVASEALLARSRALLRR